MWQRGHVLQPASRGASQDVWPLLGSCHVVHLYINVYYLWRVWILKDSQMIWSNVRLYFWWWLLQSNWLPFLCNLPITDDIQLCDLDHGGSFSWLVPVSLSSFTCSSWVCQQRHKKLGGFLLWWWCMWVMRLRRDTLFLCVRFLLNWKESHWSSDNVMFRSTHFKVTTVSVVYNPSNRYAVQ